MDNELENLDSQNEETETADSSNGEEVESEEQQPEKREYSDYEKQLYKRLKETEAKLKEVEKAAKPKQEVDTSGFSAKDIIALSKANIETEDLDEVIEYAAYKKLSLADALSSPVMKATLAAKAEERKSAQAVHTGTARRASSEKSDDRLIADAQKGILPDDEASIAKLAELRLMRKHK